ncbi:MAG: anti-sigma factor antagonist [Chitinispirillaceae bacterium]|nr:anti-sigma factor antagonist [Chitinispirillaceae bacterium]
MTVNLRHDESDEIYHRIYRLIKRRISPHIIAATLHLPLRTILGVINRLERAKSVPEFKDSSPGGEEVSNSSEFLDIYFYPKTRYAIIDLVGSLSDSYTGLLQAEIKKTLASKWKAVAIKMSAVHSLGEAAAGVLLSSKDSFASLGRYLALLDPSPEIESALGAYNVEKKIPIFGTERAFEDAAFSKKKQRFSPHGSKGTP